MTSPHLAPRVAVIGGGPAGLIAAETLASAGVSVTLFDRMPSVGRKLLMAGRGGLNLTHADPLAQVLARYPAAPAPLLAALRAFPPEALIAWANGLGQETFVGSSGRVFPKAMKASPLLRAWLARLQDLGVTIKTRHVWHGWDADGAPLISPPGGVPAAWACDAVVLALGGASWPRLGSDGQWCAAFAAQGVPVTPLRASNAGVRVDWGALFRERFSGEPLKRVCVRFGGVSERGEAVVTRSGLEGGPLYALSSALAAATAGGGPVHIELDLKPEETLEMVSARLRRPRGKDTVSNWLRKCLKLSPVAIGLLREVRHPLPEAAADLAALIKSLPLPVRGTGGLERAISTAGGVSFSALDNHFMLVQRPGTFVAGEMLDWDAPTGGYLLQASFATGVAAARGVLARLSAPSGIGVASG